MVFFRSPTLASGIDLLKGLVGQNGVALPQGFYEHLGPLAAWLHRAGVASVGPDIWTGREFGTMVLWVLALMVIALAVPNTLQILCHYEPALGVRPQSKQAAARRLLEWKASLPWAIAVSVLVAVGIASLGGYSEFIYWQF